jgi:diguanylate cyclase (GGDEF)-like protein
LSAADSTPQASTDDTRYLRPDLVYSVCLFVVAVAAIAFAMWQRDGIVAASDWGSVVFFLLFGLFTISCGFPHPDFGHISFDRVAQVASILVLGPVDAAWINGIASFIYPWHRLKLGVPLPLVLTAALNNAGLMSLAILACGSLYAYLGGPIPLESLDLRVAGLLLLLMLSMQFFIDLGMMAVLRLRGLDPRSLYNFFATTIESFSVLAAIVIAIAWSTAELPVFVLLLVVTSAGMLVIKQYADMRQRLEALVEERTEELQTQAIEFERQATHDKLTGLPNRRYADDFLQREIEQARRKDCPVSVALADVDHFKSINDRFSHAVGDEVLRRVGTILSERCRKTDVVARYGGEEFLLCFPDTDMRFARQICNQIRQAVEHADWSDLQAATAGKLRVTVSIGLAEARGDVRRAAVLSKADTRLYRAKNAGRNRVIS